MRIRNILVSLLVIALSANFASAKPACEKSCDKPAVKQCEKRGKSHHTNPLKRVLNKLDLSEEQDIAVKEIISADKDSLKAQHKKVRSLKKELEEVSSAEELNEAELDRVSAELADAIVQKTLLKKEMKSKIFDILSEEQQLQFEELDKKMKTKGRKHKAKGPKKCPSKCQKVDEVTS